MSVTLFITGRKVLHWFIRFHPLFHTDNKCVCTKIYLLLICKILATVDMVDVHLYEFFLVFIPPTAIFIVLLVIAGLKVYIKFVLVCRIPRVFLIVIPTNLELK